MIMKTQNMAKVLGSLGGKARARKLSSAKRREIARAGAVARIKSLQMKRRILENFSYLRAVEKLAPKTPAVKREKNYTGKLLGIKNECK